MAEDLIHPVIHPLILCGGSGTRLWPLSRAQFPKQFAPLIGEGSLFQQCARRLAGPGWAAPVVVTAADFRFVVRDQLAEAGIEPAAVLIEPEAKDTAAAVLAGVLQVAAEDPDAMVLVAPSDHLIPDAEAFRAAVREGVAAAEAGRSRHLRRRPHRAETGYGYLELPEGAEGDAAVRLLRFVEKPDRAAAEAMLASGAVPLERGAVPGAGAGFRRGLRGACPRSDRAGARSEGGARSDLGFLRLDPAPGPRRGRSRSTTR
jgi:mannose-1-phosphate guanylyltransferase / mannose-6-phosphate isomerase